MKTSNMLLAFEYYRGAKGFQPDPVLQSNILSLDTPGQDDVMDMARIVFKSCKIAHWFQHWSSFAYWHCRLFLEIRGGFLNSESSYDPTATWYQDELVFFEHRIRDFTTALQAEGLSTEYAERAEDNYREWQMNG